jgi:dTMP kinase
MSKGIFITFEGGEGSGKTSVIQAIQQHLQSAGRQVKVTREPGGVDIAEQIRAVILDTNNTKMDGRTEALLYAAARRQHLVEVIEPALRRGEVLLCDRFLDSSLVYQGVARGLGVEAVWDINRFAIAEFMPQVTFYLDIEPTIGLARIHANANREVNRLDLEAIGFHEKIREGYLQLANKYTDRIQRIDASRSLDEVVADVVARVARVLEDSQ